MWPVMSTPESKSVALQKRLVSFASEMIRVSANLPKTMEGKSYFETNPAIWDRGGSKLR
jgi:hypothetical protein